MADQNNFSDSAVGTFTLKVGMVFSKVKDAVVKDFIDGLGLEDMTWDDFVAECDSKGVAFLDEFLTKIITKLGYDLSNCESKDIQDLIKSLFVTTDKLARTIQALVVENKDKDITTLIQEYVDKTEQAQSKKKADKDKDSKGTESKSTKDVSNELFGEDDDFKELYSKSFKGGDLSVSIGFGEGLGKVQLVIELVQEIVNLIKKFSQMEWESIANDVENFGEFFQDKYLSETFGKKILDYVLLLLFRNAKEVFREDIDVLIDNIDDCATDIKENLPAGIKFEDVKKDILTYKKLVDDVKVQIEKEKEQLIEDAQEFCVTVASEASQFLQSQLNVAEQRLSALITEAFGGYDSIARVFDRIYRIFDLLGFIGEETVPTTLYLPLPDKFFDQLGMKSGSGDKAGIPIDNEFVTSAVTTIQSIKWGKIEQLFTEPRKYFTSTFKIKDINDAERLLAKITAVVHSFNDDFPEIKSARQFVLDLLARIENRLSEALEPLATEVRAKLEALKGYLQELLRIFEAFVVEIKKQFTAAFEDFENGAKSVFGELKDSVDSVIKEIDKDIISKLDLSKIGDNFVLETSLVQIESNDFNRAFVTPLINAVAEKAPVYFKVPDVNALKKSVKTKLEESIKCTPDKNILKSATMMVAGIKGDVISTFSLDWENVFISTVNELSDEFKFQMRNVPADYQAVKDFAIANGRDIIQGKGKNPFSDFDIMAYFNIIADKLTSSIPFNPQKYYSDASAFVDSLLTRDLLSVSVEFNFDKEKDDAEELEKTIKAFVQDVLSEYWSKLRDSLYNIYVKPYINKVKAEVKKWSQDILDELIKAVSELIKNTITDSSFHQSYDSLFVGQKDNDEYSVGGKALQNTATGFVSKNNLTGVTSELHEDEDGGKYWIPVDSSSSSSSSDKGASGSGSKGSSSLSGSSFDAHKALSIATDAVTSAMNLMKVIPQAKEIDSWKDGVQFAINLYKIIPKDVKTALRSLISLPEWDFSQIQLPEYTLDTENKFLAVTVYKWDDKTDDGKISGGVSFQIVAFVGDMTCGDETKSGLYILPVIDGKFNAGIALGEDHELSIKASAKLNEGFDKPKKDSKASDEDKKANEDLKMLGLFFYGADESFDINVIPLADAKSVSAYLELLFTRKAEPLSIFETDLAKLTLGNYPQKVYIGYDKEGFDVGYQGQIQDLKLSLMLGNANDFFKKILSNDIEINLEKLAVGYSYRDGFNIDGAFLCEIPFNTNIDLKAVKFSNIAAQIGGKDGDLVAAFKTSFTVNLDVVAISFSDMGLGCGINILSKDGKGFGDFDFKPAFMFPDGLAITIDAEAVKGTGIVQWKKDEGRFLGAISLEILELVSAGAILLFNTGNEKSPFSFMGALSVEFNPGIQVGMGFSINAIGGSLGVNRALDMDKLREAVYDGSLGTILFIKDFNADKIDKVLANITAYYPQAKDQFFFGFLTQIRWTDIIKADVGLFIQAPNPICIFIAGDLKISIAEAAESLLAINVAFMGGVDLSKGLFFDASLHDSQIVGIQLYGDMALRIYWAGDTRGFILSAGGFHPQYTPESGFNIPKMRRLGMKLDYKIVKISLESYFAITSNTVQFGSDFNLVVGWEKFGLVGYLKFNALFQFKPFKFMVDMAAGIVVKVGSVTLMSISLDFALSGPSQWNVKGKASFWVLFIKIKVGFDYSWGKKQVAENRTRVDVLPMFVDSFNDNANWKTISSDLGDNLVKIAVIDNGDVIIQPSDILSFCQSSVPVNTNLEKYGEDVVNDYSRIDIISIFVGDEDPDKKDENNPDDGDKKKEEAPTFEMETDSFAPAMIRNMSEKEKLSANSYEDMCAGFKLLAGFDTTTGETVDSKATVVEKAPDLDPNDAGFILGDEMMKQWADKASRCGGYEKRQTKVSSEISRVPLMERASSRRTSAGFERYTRSIDAANRIDYKKLLNELKK